MDLEKTPGLTEAERDAVVAYEEAHFLHAGATMDAALNASGTEDGAEDLARAVTRIEGAYSRLSELAPPGTPGGQGGMGYGELLALLRGRGLGERDAVRPDDPPVPWAELPPARLLVFCCLGLMHYGFLTGGALDWAPGYSRKARLYDVPEGVREALGEEGIAGAAPTVTATSSRCACGGCSRGPLSTAPRSAATSCEP